MSHLSFRRAFAVLVVLPLFSCSSLWATDYSWTDGWYYLSAVSPGLPSTILSTDSLTIAPKTNGNNNLYDGASGLKVFGDSVSVINQGTITWTDSDWDLYFRGGSQLTNAGLFDIKVDRAIIYPGTGAGGNTILNGSIGIIRKTAGIGTSSFAFSNSFSDESQFINTGILDAQIGTLSYSMPILHFQDGTRFTGAGTHLVIPTNILDFSGSITVAPGTTLNLDAPGQYLSITGISAVLHGVANLKGGSIAGSWTIASDGNLVSASGGVGPRIHGATLTNLGTISIAHASLPFVTSTITNQGAIDFSDDFNFGRDGLGSFPTLDNQGTIRKSGGTGVSVLGTLGQPDLNFTNPSTGLIDVQTGTLALHSGNFTSNDGAIKVAANTKLQLLEPLTNHGSISGSGTLEVVNGTKKITNHGQLSPGSSPGTLSILGDFQQDAAGHLNIEIAGTSPGQFDVLSVSGAAALDGTVDLWRLPSYSPHVGDTFLFLSASSVSGDLDPVYHGFEGVTFGDLYYSSTGAGVTITATVPEPFSLSLLAFGALALFRRPNR